jgi:citrate lyase beta subunit
LIGSGTEAGKGIMGQIRTVFQFLVPGSAATLKRIISGGSDSPKIAVVLDLEDGVRDVICLENTAQQKAHIRKRFFEALSSMNTGSRKEKLGLRINEAGTREFDNDIHFLKQLGSDFHWDYLVLPKINSVREINFCRELFSEHGISVNELIPIVETVKAYSQIRNILSAPPSPLFNRIFWGHHDYNLDAGIWPFAEQQSHTYWELTSALIRETEHAGYGYINGPFLQLKNDRMLREIISAVAFLSGRDFDQAALSYHQALFLSRMPEVIPASFRNLCSEYAISESGKKNLALLTQLKFKEFLVNNRNFSIDQEDQVIISPHQYLGALHYLETLALVKPL